MLYTIDIKHFGICQVNFILSFCYQCKAVKEMKRGIALIISELIVINIFSQTFITREFLPDTCNHDIFFRLEASMFFKNNEYFTPYTASYTWPGFYLKPQLQYYLTPGTRTSIGYFFQKFFGWDKFWRTIPVFTVQQRLAPGVDLVFGNIYGTLNHGMEEALLRFDRYITKPMEYGIQLIYKQPKFSGDTWLNWERFIYFNSTVQEEIQFGHNSLVQVMDYDDVKVRLPLQILVYHRGGHLLTPIRILTVANLMYGFEIDKPLPDGSVFTIEPLMFLYQGLNVPDTGRNVLPYKHGSAFYFKFKYTKRNLNAMIGLWMPTQFIAPEGEYLISDISEIYTSYYEFSRFLFIGKIAFHRQTAKYSHWEINAGFYYDPWLKNFAYYYGLYFTINQPFYFGKIHPEKVRLSDMKLPKKL